MKRVRASLVAALLMPGCGGPSSSPTPVSPSPVDGCGYGLTASIPTSASPLAPLTTGGYTLAGTVYEEWEPDDGEPAVADALVVVLEGRQRGRSTRTDDEGWYSLVGLCGGLTLRVGKDGYESEDRKVVLSEDTVLNVVLKRR